MLLKRVCLLRNFPNLKYAARPNLVFNYHLPCHWLATERKRVGETQFIAQFVPNYMPKGKDILLDDGFEIESDYSNRTTDEVVGVFEKLSHYCASMQSSISEEKYDPIVKAVIQKLPDMNDEELMKVLVDLTRFPHPSSPKERNFSELWNCIDDQLWLKLNYWKFPEILKAMNAYYRLGMNKISPFNSKAILKITRKVEDLPPSMLVEAMFYQSIIRHDDVQMYNVESRFYQIIDELDINEIGIMCIAFFKREAKILNEKLLSRIYQRVINEIDDVKDLTLVNIAKIVRYSSKPVHSNEMKKLFHVLESRIDNYNILTCLHVALVGTNLQLCHPKIIEKIIKRMNENISTVRLKELDRLSLVISLFDIETTSGIEVEFMKNVLLQLKIRVDEIIKHPRCFTSTIHYLSTKGIYDLELIEEALKQKFIYFAYGKNQKSYSREILCLEGFTKINLKGIYTGTQLSDKLRKSIATFQSHYIPYRGQPHKMTYSDKLTLDIQEFTDFKFGASALTQVLPHFERPDIIVCFDENGKPVTSDIINKFSERAVHTGQIYSKEFVLSQVPEFADKIDKLKMVAIVVGGWNFYLRDTKKPTGVLRMKLEQLEMIGYKPVLINYNDWNSAHLQEKQDLLVNNVNAAINSV